MSTDQGAPPALKHSPWLALIVIALGYFMNVLDSTVVNVAIPSITSSLDASTGEILWVINGYLLPYAMLLLLAGRLGDILGHRTVFVFGLSLFVLASVACGLAQQPEQLVAARVAQGIGAAAAAPQALAITSAVFPPERRALAFGVLASIIGSAAAAGPFLGGLITDVLNWRWIFFLNVPIGVIGLIGAFLFVPKTRIGGRQRLAIAPVVLASVGLFGVLFALMEGHRFDWGEVWGPIQIVHILVAGVVVFAGFVFWEWSRPGGLLPKALFTSRNYGLMVWASLATYFGIFGTQLAMTIYLQSVLHIGPLEAGLVLSPMWLASSLVSPLGGRLAERVQPRWILITGFVVFAAGTALTALFATTDAAWGVFVLTLVLAGFGAGFTFAPLTTVAMSEVAPRAAGGASGLIEMSRMIGSAVCTAVVGAILADARILSGDELAADTRIALILTAAIVAVAALTTLLLKPTPTSPQNPTTQKEQSPARG